MIRSHSFIRFAEGNPLSAIRYTRNGYAKRSAAN
jgi:hypothetical protein